MRLALLLLLAGANVAAAEDEIAPKKPPPPFHFSVSAGTSLLLFGQGDGGRNRLDAAIDVMPGGRWGRWGLIGAIRHVVLDPFADDGFATIGVRYEAAAARPRLALALHADLGAELSPGAPLAGGGIETHFWIAPKKLGPLALISDVTVHLVLDGTDNTRLVIGAATRVALAF